MISHHRFDGSPQKRLAARAEAKDLCAREGSFVLLETCDRLEIFVGDGQADFELRWHVARVCAGLDSPLLGEKAIMGQVRESYKAAVDSGHISKGLHRLFQEGIKLGRLCRTHTEIDKGAIGHGQGVIEILKSMGRPKPDELILLIGVNDLTHSIIQYLCKNHGRNIILANRTIEHAKSVAGPLGIEVGHLDNLKSYLGLAGIVISGTSAPHYIIRSEDFDLALMSRDCEQVFFDLAAPPDIEPSVSELSGVQVLGLKDIERRLEHNLKKRSLEAKRAQEIIDFELARARDKINTFEIGQH